MQVPELEKHPMFLSFSLVFYLLYTTVSHVGSDTWN